MAVKMVMRTARPTVKIMRPRPFGAGHAWKAVNFRWREWATRQDRIIALATGMEVPATVEACKHWHAEQKHAAVVAGYYESTGQRLSDFYVCQGGKRIGHGFFPPNVTLDDVPYFFQRLRAQGLEGVLAYESYDEDEFFGNIPWTACALIAKFDPNEASPMPACEHGMTISFAHMEYDQHGKLRDNPLRECLTLLPGETMPQHFAGMYWAKLAMYRKVLAACKPEAFRIYNVRYTMKEPTPLWEMRDDGHYWCVDTVADGDDGGGYYTEAHGCFDELPTAEQLAHIACRLAAQSRWVVLVPHARDRVSEEIRALMSSPNEDFELESEVVIKPTVVGAV